MVVEAEAGGASGLGFSYTSQAAVRVIEQQLAPCVVWPDAMDIPAAWGAMVAAVRNLGLPGIAATAISAVDIALWDLKARLLELPLTTLLGSVRESVPIYASGGFTSFDVDELQQQLAGWVDDEISQVKIKVGRSPVDDPERVRAARLDKGDKVMEELEAFAREQAMTAACFTAIGALSDVKLGYFDWDQKDYLEIPVATLPCSKHMVGRRSR